MTTTMTMTTSTTMTKTTTMTMTMTTTMCAVEKELPAVPRRAKILL